MSKEKEVLIAVMVPRDFVSVRSVDAAAAIDQLRAENARQAELIKILDEADNELRTENATLVTKIAEQAEECEQQSFQSRVGDWLLACFGESISADKIERNHRFLEEALELVQALGCTADEAHKLVDYVFGRTVGEPIQEVGGVMVTLAALCRASDIDLNAAAETELARVWTKVEQIREKQKRKPSMSPLPGIYPDRIEQPAAQIGNASYRETVMYETLERHSIQLLELKLAARGCNDEPV